MILTRINTSPDGVFSSLSDDEGNILYYTLEHAFVQPDGSYAPKLNIGTHTCILGDHQLDHGGVFKAFEITGVPGHSGILFHIGNYNVDSDGCVLLGMSYTDSSVLNSKAAFTEFMEKMGTNNFQLAVR
jgi:hypothetical protein